MARPKYSEEVVADRVDGILNAAMKLLESGGIESVSLRKTATALGWSSAAIYRYFENKQDLMVALRARAFRWMENELRSSIDQTADALVNLENISNAYIEAGLFRPDLYQLMFFEFIQEETSNHIKDLELAKQNCLAVCTEVVAHAQANQEMAQTVDPLTASHVFWVSAHGLVSLEIANQFVMGRKISMLSSIVTTNVLTGLNHVKP